MHGVPLARDNTPPAKELLNAHALGKTQLGQQSAAVEGIFSDCSDCRGDADRGEGAAFVEGIVSDRCESLGEDDGGEGPTAAESYTFRS